MTLGRAQVYGLFAYLIHDDSTRQELETQVEAHVGKVAKEIKRSGIADYHRWRVAGLNAIRKLLRAEQDANVNQ